MERHRSRETAIERSTETARQRQLRSPLVSLLEPIFEEDAIEPCSFAKMKDEADLEIRRREASKELPLCIRVERFPGFVLDDHRTVDAHVHSLVRQRFTAKVYHHRDFPFDFVPVRDQKTFQRARGDVLAKPEAEFLVDFEKGIDDRRGDVTVEQGVLARMRQSSRALKAVSSCVCR